MGGISMNQGDHPRSSGQGPGASPVVALGEPCTAPRKERGGVACHQGHMDAHTEHTKHWQTNRGSLIVCMRREPGRAGRRGTCWPPSSMSSPFSRFSMYTLHCRQWHVLCYVCLCEGDLGILGIL